MWKLPERTPEQIKQAEELEVLLKKSAEAFALMSSAEKEVMFKKQRESWIRGMMPLGHEESLEWCEAELVKVEEKIASATSWGAYLSVLNEDAQDLRSRIRLKRQAAQASE